MDYLSRLVPERIKRIPFYMDFEGQKKAEKIFQVTILLFAGVGFAWGYVCQQFSQTIYILLAGFTLACLITLPPWPMYRQNPLNWQPAQNFDQQTTETIKPSSPAATNKSKKKKQ